MIDLREDIESGQQVESFAVDALVDGTWTEIATATAIGHRRLIALDAPVTADAVRVRVLAARGPAEVSVSVHHDPTL